jgi:hypothetical protein
MTDRLKKAAASLIYNIYQRHPGEQLRCPFMIELRDALLDAEDRCNAPSPRTEAYAAIDSEREYQNTVWADAGSPTGGNRLTIGESILLVEEYAARARKDWSTEPKPEVEALNGIRKIAGIAVHCMEQHGAPLRRMPTPKPTPPMRATPQARRRAHQKLKEDIEKMFRADKADEGGSRWRQLFMDRRK